MLQKINNKNLLYFIGLAAFIINVLMFDYLSWDIWWVPVVQIILTIIIWWVVIRIFKIAKREKSKETVEQREVEKKKLIKRIIPVLLISLAITNYFLISNGDFPWWNILITNIILISMFIVVWKYLYKKDKNG